MNSKEISNKINELRNVLNVLMSDDFRENYEDILEVSIKLDKLIFECYTIKDNKGKY